MSSRIIRIKIGTEEHQLVKNDKPGCFGCSLESMCLRMGNCEKPLCEALMYMHGDMLFERGIFKEIKK